MEATANRTPARRVGGKVAERAAATLRDPRWPAVAARDAAADGTFVFAVRTTGVFCRPSCAARQPRPENVEFFADAAAALRGGYRACKRCTPDRATPSHRQAQLVARLCRLLETADAVPSLKQLADHAGLSPFHVQRLFKAVTGVTPRAYAAARRAARVRDTLTVRDSVTGAIYAAGYASGGRFYAESNAILGMTPKRWRAGGVGEVLRCATAPCTLGAVLVAATARGVCAILLGDDPQQLERELRQRFPRAQLAPGDPAFARTVALVVRCVDGRAPSLDLPLDIRGTAFQQRVWQALRGIPNGSTVSYAELARQLGAPNAVRAVASACAANPLAVAVPCHRVVRKGGDLAGYRWGVARKRALLLREAGS